MRSLKNRLKKITSKTYNQLWVSYGDNIYQTTSKDGTQIFKQKEEIKDNSAKLIDVVYV